MWVKFIYKFTVRCIFAYRLYFLMQQPLFDSVCLSAVKEQLYALWQEAFGDSREYIDAFFAHFPCEECAHTLSVDGRVVAMLYVLPFNIKIACKEVSAAYIYAVATSAACRGRGYMRLLMEYVEQLLSEKGVSFIFLLPADEALRCSYSRLGYEVCSRMSVEELSPAACDRNGFFFKQVSDAALLYRYYTGVLGEMNAPVVHTPGFIGLNLFNCVSQGGGAYALFDGEGVVAVAFAMVVDGNVLLPGIFARSSFAENVLLHTLSLHFGVKKLTVCRAGSGEPYCMGRLLDKCFSSCDFSALPISLLLDK